MVSKKDKTRKLLLTIQYRYGLRPFQISRLIETRFSGNVNVEINKKLGTKNTKETLDLINSIRENKELFIFLNQSGKIKNPNSLIEKKWIYKRFPRNIDQEIKLYSKKLAKI